MLFARRVAFVGGFWKTSEGSPTSRGESSKTISGANAFRSRAQAMLLRRPGTEEGTLLPMRSSTFLSLNLAGDDKNCLGKTDAAAAAFGLDAGRFSSGLDGPVTLNLGCLNGLTGESKSGI